MKRQEQTQRILHCRVANRTYCFDASTVENVMQGAVATRDLQADLDTETHGLVGQVEYENQPLPVFRLRDLFGSNDASMSEGVVDRREHLIVANSRHGRVGALVDLVYRASHVRNNNLIALPPLAYNPERPYFRGIVRVEGNTATKLEASLLESEQVSDSESSASDDRRLPSVGRRAALLISPDGLVGGKSEQADLPTPALDFGSLLRASSQRVSQLMLFDLPHLTSADQRTAIALSVTQVLEVLRTESLIHVPGAPDSLLGLIPWRNQFVPLLDIAEQIGLGESPEDARQRIVVARSTDNQLLGFYSSTDIRTLRMPVDSRPIEDETLASHRAVIRAGFTTQDSLIVLPCLETLVG